MLVKIDEIYDKWDIETSKLLEIRLPTFKQQFKLLDLDVPQLQRHALWIIALCTGQEHSKQFQIF